MGPLPPRLALATAAPLLAIVGLPAAHALAQTGNTTGGSSTDLVAVALWTIVGVALLLLVATLGYLYRREHGMDEPRPEVPIPFSGEDDDPSLLTHPDQLAQPAGHH
jgi:hypothetical protein